MALHDVWVNESGWIKRISETMLCNKVSAQIQKHQRPGIIWWLCTICTIWIRHTAETGYGVGDQPRGCVTGSQFRCMDNLCTTQPFACPSFGKVQHGWYHNSSGTPFICLWPKAENLYWFKSKKVFYKLGMKPGLLDYFIRFHCAEDHRFLNIRKLISFVCPISYL